MSQKRLKWDSLALSRDEFWMLWRFYCIPCFHFFFFLETTVRENNSIRPTSDAIIVFFRKYHSENTWSQLCSKFFPWQRHSKGTLQLKILRIWINIGANFFLSKYLETKINTSYTKIQACSSKNIASKHLNYYCMLLYLSHKPSF